MTCFSWRACSARYLFRAFQIVDVGINAIPTDNLPLLVAKGQGTGLEPTKGAIGRAEPLFHLVHRAGRGCQLPLLRHTRRIVWMEAAFPIKGRCLFAGYA